MDRPMFFKVMVVMFVGLMLNTGAEAATYYVRTDGGSATQCTGTSDSPYPGSGSLQPCAFNHPFWAISPIGNNPTKMVGGDTLIIDGSNGAQYKMGLGAPNTSDTTRCYSAWPWDCYMRSIPAGPSPAQPTRILGKGWDTGCTNPPQLWGNERANMLINMGGSSNVELQCLEVTDHSECQVFGPNACNRNTAPFGAWAVTGLFSADSTNVLLKNVNIHGLYRGIHAGRLTDWTLENSKIVANSFVGWDGDIGAGASSNSGTLTFKNTNIQYNGCGETYPGLQPYNCYSQDQGGYGDGLGTHQTGGHWVFDNVDFSHNVSDGLDLLYHSGNGSITIKRSRFEGNAGNQVKTKGNALIENSLIIGNCAYFANSPMTWNTSTFNNCRAGGDTIALALGNGSRIDIRNSTVTSNGNVMVLSAGSTCNGSEQIVSRNNVFVGGIEYHDGNDKSALYYASGAGGNGDGACGGIGFNEDYSVIYNTKHGLSDCNNRPHSRCEDPKLMTSWLSYYTGNAFDANLQSISPARNAASILTGVSPLDFNFYDRGTAWDSGALEFGSVPSGGSGGGGGSTGPVCGNRVVEAPETCDDGNTTGGDGCSPTCVIEPSSCGNGRLETGEQCDDNNTVNWDGCSSACTIEVPVCGNNHMEQGEQCDDGNTASGDGCSVVCQAEFCGDNVVQSGLNEQCDDGNTVNGDGCSSTCTTEQQSNYQLMLSYSANRSSAVQLGGQVNGQNVYIFVTPTTNIKRVKFFLDAPSATGTPRQTENVAPYDFVGTAGNMDANSFNAGSLSAQQHTVTAQVVRLDDSVVTVSSNFTVQSPIVPPLVIQAENFTTKTTGGAQQGGWNIWANGYIRNAANVSVAGQYRLDIVAKGQLAGSALPNMRVRVNGTTITNIPVGATSYTTFTLNVSLPRTANDIQIEFTNDYYNPARGLDRNLIVDKVTFTKL